MSQLVLSPPRGLWIPPREIVRARPRRLLSVIGRALGFMGGSGPANDPYFSSVKLLLHFDGSDGGTTFTDSSSSANAATNNNASTGTGTVKFGSAALKLDASTDYIYYPSNSVVLFGSGDFTMEGWLNYPTVSGAGAGLVAYTGTSSGNFILSCGSSGIGGTNDKLTWWTSSGAVTSTTTVTGGAWHYFAVTRSGTTLRVYVDGALEATGSDSQNHVGTLQIGSGYHSIDATSYLDDLRLTMGVARYTGSSHTVPTAAHPNA